MKLVICGSNGDPFFSGESLLSNELAESMPARRRPSIAPVRVSGPRAAERELEPPPESGVFPVRLYEGDEADNELSQSGARPSGVFSRNASYDEVSLADDVSIEEIDFEWRLLLSA